MFETEAYYLFRCLGALTMKRQAKITFLSFISLAGLVIMVCVLLLLGYQLQTEGKWPFKPLDRWRTEIVVPSAGIIVLEGVAQRGYDSDGFSISASYRPPDSTASEPMGSWTGNGSEPKAFASGALLVVLSPDQRTIFVRAGERQWNHFQMQFPDEATSLPLSFYSRITGLSEAELQQIRSDIAEDEGHWSPAVYLQGFDSQTRIVTVLY